MLRKQVYTYILKMMLAHPQAIQYYPEPDGVWITDGVIGFYIADEHQVFDLSSLMAIEGLRSVLGSAPSRTSNYLLHDTKRLKITGGYLVHIYERAGAETWIDDSLLGKFFPDKEYEYFQSASEKPVFIYPIDGQDLAGFIMPIVQTEEKSDD